MMKSVYHVDQLSRGQGPAIHRYYDVAIEEPRGTRILYFEFDSEFVPGSGSLIVAEADGSQPRVIGRAQDAIGHVGPAAAWIAPGKVAYSPNARQSPEFCIVDIDTITAQTYAGTVRSFSCENGFGLLTRVVASSSGASPLDDRLERWDPKTDSRTLLLTTQMAHQLHPLRDQFPLGSTNLMNAKWSPDGSKLFVVFTTEVYRRFSPGVATPFIKSLFTMNADGSSPRYLCEFSHHPMWTPNGRGIIAYQRREGSQDLVGFDASSGKRAILVADVPGVHASMDHNAQRIVTDIHDKDNHEAHILLIDLTTDKRTVLASGHHRDFDHTTGHHPHPQWSRDESRIFFNMMDSGISQLYAVSLS